MQDKKVIIVKNLVKKFGDFTAVNNISFDVHQGEIFGFLGANGAGKTTTIKILTGLSKPTSGDVFVAGYNIKTHTELIKRNIGYMSQKFSLFSDMTVFENIRFYAKIYGLKKNYIKEKANQLLEELNLDKYRDTLVKSLPLGWKQKLAFSLAIFHNPKIVFLDEPTSGVDPITRRMFWELIYKAALNGTTVFVTTHYLDEAEYCDTVAIMSKGEIVANDHPAQLKALYNAQNMNDVFVKIVNKHQ